MGYSDAGARRYIWGQNRDLRAIQWAVLAKSLEASRGGGGYTSSIDDHVEAEHGGRMEKAATGQG
jgi:hypothetical protein